MRHAYVKIPISNVNKMTINIQVTKNGKKKIVRSYHLFTNLESTKTEGKNEAAAK